MWDLVNHSLAKSGLRQLVGGCRSPVFNNRKVPQMVNTIKLAA